MISLSGTEDREQFARSGLAARGLSLNKQTLVHPHRKMMGDRWILYLGLVTIELIPRTN